MILIQLCWFYDSIASDSMFSFWLYSVCSHKRWQTTRPLVRTQRAATRTGRRSGTMALSLWATSPESCKFSPLLFTSPSVLFQLDLFICVFEIDIIISVCLFYLRPAVQSSSESYGGLTEDSLGDAYNASKDGTLVMREVTNAPLHTHTHTVCFYSNSHHCISLFVGCVNSVVPARLRKRGEVATLRATGLGTTVTLVTSLTLCSRATLPRRHPPRPCRSWVTFMRSDAHFYVTCT